jgi:hypothetical protein
MSPEAELEEPEIEDGGEWDDEGFAHRGLLWVTFWTVAGTLLPGLGLAVAGHRRLGVALFGAALAIGLRLGTRWQQVIERFRVDLDPAGLLDAAATVGVAAVLFVVLLVGTNLALMRHTAGGQWTRAGNRTLVVLLAGAIAVPAYAMVINLLLTRASLLAALEQGPLG